MNKNIMRLMIICFILAFFIAYSLDGFFYKQHIEYSLINTVDLKKISTMDISGQGLYVIYNYCIKNDIDFSRYLSGYMSYNDYNVDSVGSDLEAEYYQDGYNEGIEQLYSMIFDDIECFPIETLEGIDDTRYQYANSFLAPRSYGGDRQHLGVDIMDAENESGYFPIISMTDGVIENLGWLELGGYRVGIRSVGGSYFYYAHLERYAEGIDIGDEIEAGQILGYMGSTGYGKEGTNDQFAVHLHLGILLDIGKEEVWINPYPVLKMVELLGNYK